MKKILLSFFILFLIFVTSYIKNATKNLDIEIFNSKEEISLLKDELQMLQLEYDYLSSPEKLDYFLETYFKDRFISTNLNSAGIISFSKEKVDIIELKDK